jgi:hypothetical protein
MPGKDREDRLFLCRPGWGEKPHLELSQSRLTSRPGQGNCRLENIGAGKSKTGIAPENRNGVAIMARTKNPVPHAARSAADAATIPASAPIAPAAGDSPAAAVLAALSAEPAGAPVAVIAGRAGISTAAARQALLAQEKAGTAT